MKKVVKLSIKDLENIVKRTINESEVVDTTNEDLEMSDEPETGMVKRNIAIGKGDDGKIYVTDVDTGEILGTK